MKNKMSWMVLLAILLIPTNTCFATGWNDYNLYIGNGYSVVRANAFAGDDFKEIDTSKIFYFVVDVESAKADGPMSAEAFNVYPAVAATKGFQWVRPNNPNFWTPFLGSLFFLAIALPLLYFIYWYVTFPVTALLIVLYVIMRRRNPTMAALVVKATAFTILVPGTVLGVLPLLILGSSGAEWPEVSARMIMAALLAMVGVGVLIHCVWGFAFYGRGTPAPIDPPKTLVVNGLYRYTRNPMYLGVILVLLSESLSFLSRPMLIYAAIVSCAFHLFVVFYEEPKLRALFGETYENYRRAVPRWGFTARAWKR